MPPRRLPYRDLAVVAWAVYGVGRKTGKKGAWVAGRFIPPETTIVTPQYVISRRKCKPLSYPTYGTPIAY